ncbi:MAG TPA: hypothetical protein VF971_09225 [Candidatus Limnocylindrales bacterium]|jgi:hypothetical protein
MDHRRRDLFILVPAPGRADEAAAFASAWLRQLDGHPGYLGGVVVRESAGEMLENTMAVMIEFEDTAAAKALWPKIENLVTPISSDVAGAQPRDQAPVLTQFLIDRGDDHSEATELRADATRKLEFNRGNGLFARLLHMHGEILDDYPASGAGPMA